MERNNNYLGDRILWWRATTGRLALAKANFCKPGGFGAKWGFPWLIWGLAEVIAGNDFSGEDDDDDDVVCKDFSGLANRGTPLLLSVFALAGAGQELELEPEPIPKSDDLLATALHDLELMGEDNWDADEWLGLGLALGLFETGLVVVIDFVVAETDNWSFVLL